MAKKVARLDQQTAIDEVAIGVAQRQAMRNPSNKERGSWAALIAVIGPMLLEAFKNCEKKNRPSKTKRREQIDGEYRRLKRERRAGKKMKVHKIAQQVFASQEAVTANDGLAIDQELGEDIYAECVSYAYDEIELLSAFAASR